MLRGRSYLVGDPPSFWSLTEDAALLVESVPNAAALVASGCAQPFHHCIGGVVAARVELPILGVYVWPDSIELDYQMGLEWGPPQVIGFFQLLRDCCALDFSAVVTPAQNEGPPYPDRFAKAWTLYNQNQKPRNQSRS